MFMNPQQNGNNQFKQTGPYKFQQPNYNNQNPPKNLDNVSMENNPSNLSKSKSHRSGFDQQFAVTITRIPTKKDNTSLLRTIK